MATQEELTALFARNLNLHNNYVTPAPELEPVPAPVETPIVYSISQHYHHSAHVVQPAQPARPASEPPQTDQLTAEIILSRHGVDVASLFPSQLELFKTAGPSQQMRLVELWRICPPDYGGHALAQDISHWTTTSVEQEEAMAKLRYERQILEERMSRTGGDQSMDSDTMSDSSIAGPLTPVQGPDGRWGIAGGSTAEPYMASGYEALAQREYEQSSAPHSKDIYSHFGNSVGAHAYNKSTDPVYNTNESMHGGSNIGGDWQHLIEQRQMAMENQYGSYTEQSQQWNGGVAITGQEDEEML
ncbi:hypothetical protein GLAREA_00250 [Glarea lozoyensis ATCC 20868]|uniref:Uncharacterized protein n=1 Tax=Glarea lozoyensis (strain ATCC 20868 / MF5171) TaxID=1116229 RepID=S3CRI7_GLAL2|nr:uncharacterized protein GLAREA_00250 [Glarea lozoyensis ATCC 20868]EPE29092.1 hypothetical protein GLAREA_00250 [Glarea lozoyensis ATCC 20868]